MTSACSFSENDASDQNVDGGFSQGSDTDTTTSAGTTTGEAEGEDTGTSDGDEENGTEPQAGPEDPDLDVELCDPAAQRVLAYGLEQANAEAEPVLVRESVLAGAAALVPAMPLSARPFLNHFDYFYPPSDFWDPQISGELWQSPMLNADAPPRYRLQYAIRGPQMFGTQRLPVDLAIVVDLGAVMAGEPLALAQEALAALDAALVPGDRVSLIAAGTAPILLGTAMVDDFGLSPLTGFDELVIEQDGALADVSAALLLAYETISEPWSGQGQPRVLLISNGHFETEPTLLDEIEAHAGEGRYLVSVGVGDPAIFDAARIAELAREGRGSMLFARNPDELWLELEQDFTAHLVACASDLEVTLTLPPGLGLRERDPYIGAKIDPKLALLGPNRALVFHHELEACSELPLDAVIRVEIQWTDPLAGQAKQAVWEQPVLELSEVSLSGQKGAATVAYARALRAIRDDGPAASYGIVLDALSLISDALAAMPEDQELIEMSAVIGKLTG